MRTARPGAARTAMHTDRGLAALTPLPPPLPAAGSSRPSADCTQQPDHDQQAADQARARHAGNLVV